MTGQNTLIKIGLVDDHPLFKRVMESVLSSQVHLQVVLDASNGVDLIEKLSHIQPDIILLDLTMPIMGGLEVLPIVLKNYPNIKVIVLSLHDDAELITQVLKMGACTYLLKTDTPAFMIKQIENCWISGGRS